MDTFFGLRKNRPRQSSLSGQDLNERSVPYDKTVPARSPIAVGTVNQGIRGISAPNTNPSLSVSGTEMNKFRVRSRMDDSPTSLSTADSSTIYNDPIVSPNNTTPALHPQTARLRRNDVASMRSHGQDFGQISSQENPAPPRPTSGMTVKSDTTRHSRYTQSFSSSDSAPHTHHPFSLHLRQASESFSFPRPPDDEIEVLFEKVRQTRGDPKGFTDLSMDQKWELVKNDEQIRWVEQRKREQSRKHHESGQPIMPETPEWYIQKFISRTITAKQASDLQVCLRSKEMG